MSDASLEQHISDIKEQARITEEKKLQASNSIELPDSPEMEIPGTELRCRATWKSEGDIIGTVENSDLPFLEYRGETGAQLCQAELESMLAE